VIVNPNLYRRTLDAMKDAILKASVLESPPYQTLTLLSLGSHVPIAAVIKYAMRPDMHGHLSSLSAYLEKIIAFYGYAEVKEFDDLR
jgi:hypothetical protein